MTINSKKKNLDLLENCQKYALKIVLKCLFLARIGRPNIPRSVNKLARPVTKWTRACNKRLSRLISYYTTRVNLSNLVMWETLHNNADWDCFRTLSLLEILKTQNRPRVRNPVYLWKSHVCSQKLSDSHSSTEFEIISLDAGVRMDGIPALDLWDLVIEVLHSSSNRSKKSKENVTGNLLHDTSPRKQTNTQTEAQIQHNDLELSNVYYVSSNVNSSHSGAMLYICEDNEAVIKMILEGRSPTMRHVSRTNRVAFDW